MIEPFVSKYRPRNLSDYYLPSDIVEVFKTVSAMDALNVLIIADTGCGKTALTKTLVNLYYGDSLQPSKENIMYITSLQEQGISFYRNEVKTFCQTPSTIVGKKKMLIIDDLDTVNDQSQQVFRNCIDKFSHNVQFISTCTNIQKIIESLQSRTTIVKLPKITTEELMHFCNKLCVQEDLSVSQEAREFIVSVCNYSLRTLINYLEKFRLIDDNITLELAQNVCTNINFDRLLTYTNYCFDRQLIPAINILHESVEAGFSVMDILDSYFLFTKSTHLLTETQKYTIVPILCKYMTIFHNIDEDELELSFFTAELQEAIGK
jgi:replication-associated recombination protein RarA